MATAEFTIESPLSIEEAFDRVADLTRVNEWDSGVSNANQVAGTAPCAGAKYEVTVAGFDGNPSTMVYEIEEFDRPSSFMMRGIGRDVIAVDVLTFTANEGGAGCSLHYEASLELVAPSEKMTDEVLQKIFDKVAAVPRNGLVGFLSA